MTIPRDLLEVLPVGVLQLDPENRILFGNTASKAIPGWKTGEIPEFTLPCPGELADVQLHGDDGAVIDVHITSLPRCGSDGENLGSLLFLSDVSSRRAAKNAERFRELLEAAPDAIIEVDADGCIALLNRVTEQLFGYRREELLGRPVEVLIPTEIRSRHVEYRKQYWRNPSTRPMGTGLQLEGQRKDGSRFPVEISLSPVKFEEGFRVSAIIRDVSDRRLAEQQLRVVQARYTEDLAAKNRELEARNQEVERANSLKSEFLSGMSHELRTPLHTIIGFTELLAEQIEGPLNEKQRRFVSHILRDSQHLLALINDVLDLSKIESGRLHLQKQLFVLNDALEETLSSIRPRADVKSIRIETAVDQVPGEMFADRLRVKQILYNLLSNAVKFTPAGGLIRIEATTEDEFVEISVVDNGVGIPADEQDAVFDKFYQVGRRQAGGQEGTGLGLAITRQLVHEHGGAMALKSDVGKGSRFTFTLPLRPEGEGA